MRKLKVTIKGTTYLVETLSPELKEKFKAEIEKAESKLIKVEKVDKNDKKKFD